MEITLDYTNTLYSPCSGVGREPIRTAAYFEHLSISRATQTVQLTQEIGPDCTASQRYQVKEAMGEMLYYFDEIELFPTQYPPGEYCVKSPCSNQEPSIALTIGSRHNAPGTPQVKRRPGASFNLVSVLAGGCTAAPPTALPAPLPAPIGPAARF